MLLKKCNLRLARLFSQTSASLESAKPLRSKKAKSAIDRKTHFVDFRTVNAIGGKGGNGCIAFLQLWTNPLAGPSGGDGGNGGHVIFEVSRLVKSLEHVQTVIKGEDGKKGMGKDMHGANGKHTVIPVPIGTQVTRHDEQVVFLDEPDTQYIAARGGAGGHGNHYYLSNTNRHPEIAEKGSEGENNKCALELKIMAHVGLVGFPNAGKSTFLRAISRARPKVAAYPFTTLNPHVGIVHYDDYTQLAVADLPGLIPDAHKDRGLGISFLKHIERCLFLLYVIDLSSEDTFGQLQCLYYELEQYKKGLSKRPHALVCNKCDLPSALENLKELEQNVDMPIFPISAKYGTNVRKLLDYMRHLYDEHNKNSLVW